MNEENYATQERTEETADAAPADRQGIRKVVTKDLFFLPIDVFKRLQADSGSLQELNSF